MGRREFRKQCGEGGGWEEGSAVYMSLSSSRVHTVQYDNRWIVPI